MQKSLNQILEEQQRIEAEVCEAIAQAAQAGVASRQKARKTKQRLDLRLRKLHLRGLQKTNINIMEKLFCQAKVKKDTLKGKCQTEMKDLPKEWTKDIENLMQDTALDIDRLSVEVRNQIEGAEAAWALDIDQADEDADAEQYKEAMKNYIKKFSQDPESTLKQFVDKAGEYVTAHKWILQAIKDYTKALTEKDVAAQDLAANEVEDDLKLCAQLLEYLQSHAAPCHTEWTDEDLVKGKAKLTPGIRIAKDTNAIMEMGYYKEQKDWVLQMMAKAGRPPPPSNKEYINPYRPPSRVPVLVFPIWIATHFPKNVDTSHRKTIQH